MAIFVNILFYYTLIDWLIGW